VDEPQQQRRQDQCQRERDREALTASRVGAQLRERFRQRYRVIDACHDSYSAEANRPAVQIESLIREIPDFPQPGILFRDITPLLGDPQGFKTAIDLFVERYRKSRLDYIVGVEARGYMFAAPLAYALHVGFVPVRKPGKLPAATFSEQYSLEYGTNHLEIHEDALEAGKRVLIVDDLLATGGTVAATMRLLKRIGAHVVGVGVLIELKALGGRAVLSGVDVTSFLTY